MDEGRQAVERDEPVGAARRWRVALACNLGQPPFNNNLLPALRAFERVAEVQLIDPLQFRGYAPTGGARPAALPGAELVAALAETAPDLVVCLGGGLFVPARTREHLAPGTRFVGIALSDPLALATSLEIAPEFDLFYTQDPQVLDAYARVGIAARRCDIAVDLELYHPEAAAPDCDVLYYGKWTPYRDSVVSRLGRRFAVKLHAHAGETRWSLPTAPTLASPEALRSALNRARLALELALLDDAPPPYRDAWRITYRPFFAAACGVASLVEASPRLAEFFAPPEEIVTFADPDALMRGVERLLGDEWLRREIGTRARARVARDHTWDRRVRAILEDVARLPQRD